MKFLISVCTLAAMLLSVYLFQEQSGKAITFFAFVQFVLLLVSNRLG